MFCPTCGARMDGTPKFCARCGAVLAPATPPPAPAPPSAAPAWQPPPARATPPPAYGYAAPPAAPMAAAPATPTMMTIVGFVFVVLAVIAAIVAFFLGEDEAYGWSAGVYLGAAVLFAIAGGFLYLGRRRPVVGPPRGMYPGR